MKSFKLFFSFLNLLLIMSISNCIFAQKDTIHVAFQAVDVYDDSLKVKYVECISENCPSITNDYWIENGIINDTAGISEYSVYSPNQVLKSLTVFDNYLRVRYQTYDRYDSALYVNSSLYKISNNGDTLSTNIKRRSLYLPKSINTYIKNHKKYHSIVRNDNSYLRTFIQKEIDN